MDAASFEGTSPATILQNRQFSSINTTLALPAVDRDDDGDSLAAAFERWAAAERTAQAAATRSRERALREQAAGEATWAGLLVDLAETLAQVTLGVGARQLTGILVGMGRDFCVLEQRDQRLGRQFLIPNKGIVTVWPTPGPTGKGSTARQSTASGSRIPHHDLSFESALAGLADDRSPVCIRIAGGAEVSGDLVGSGADLVTVRTEPPARRIVHIRSDHIEVCELR